MRWRGRRQSANVEDQRGRSAGFGRGGGLGRGGGMRIPMGRSIGGGGISGIVILVIVFFVLRFLGIDLLAMMGEQPRGETDGTTVQSAASDEMAQFAGVVLAETEDVWNGIFEAGGQDYPEPTMVLFTDQVRSACGFASAASGPFYCPGDGKLYLDLSFFGQLASQFGASGDFAQAYVIAHEVGHHVQNVTGVLPKFNRARQTMSEVEANQMSVRVELQADCYAGIWAHYTEQKGLLEQGDIDEALNAANQIGDDTLQKRSQGYVVPDSFNHGTSAQRKEWFARGFDSGRMSDCDTFSGSL
ncbi:KPN_02809 family neutral zinc metallopeptidase [Aquibium oceanicum]|uniref:Flagellar biosynthesis protein FlgM n=1 Tax=Aquibium oceanicum TaxID=1670800 RepID=A0A1L3SRL0_9HYPH|nr:neutral zinc metallopeptidase [Aquibium oceanicum]APH72036.1 flagellar biosynthesis protein FlgM [Aquibium oceanicum]